MFPVLAEFQGNTIYSYGVLRMLSYLLAVIVVVATARILEEKLGDAALSALALLVGMQAGGRLGFVLVNWREPWTLGQILNPRAQSLAFTAVVGGLLAVVLVAVVRRRSIGGAFDLVTPSVVAAWAVGNIGCFLAGCCVGPASSVPWALRFNSDTTPLELRGTPVHPTQLYSLLFELALLAALYLWPRTFKGELFLRATAAMLLMRVGWTVVGVTGSGVGLVTWAMVFLGAVALALLLVLRGRNKTPVGAPA